MFGFCVLVDSLVLRPALRATACVSLCRSQLQSSRFRERDAGAVFANGVDGKALKFRLR